MSWFGAMPVTLMQVGFWVVSGPPAQSAFLVQGSPVGASMVRSAGCCGMEKSGGIAESPVPRSTLPPEVPPQPTRDAASVSPDKTLMKRFMLHPSVCVDGTLEKPVAYTTVGHILSRSLPTPPT